MPWKQLVTSEWWQSIIPMLLSMTSMRRRSTDDNPMPSWMAKAVSASIPFIIGGLSAAGATLTVLKINDARQAEQISELKDMIRTDVAGRFDRLEQTIIRTDSAHTQREDRIEGKLDSHIVRGK